MKLVTVANALLASRLMKFESELAAAKEAVRQASALCAATQTSLTSGETLDKSDASPVTIADYGAQALALNVIKAAFPNDPAVAEEDSEALREDANNPLFQTIVERVRDVDPSMDADSVLAAIDHGNYQGGGEGRFWTLDPIDGTKGFLRGDQYAVALALIVDGEVQLGVLGCPNLSIDPNDPDGKKGCIFYAIKGEGVIQAPLDDLETGVAIRADSIADPAKASFCESVESKHTAHGRSHDIRQALGTDVEPYRIDSQCKYAAVSRGQASIYLRLPTRPGYEEKIWDHAAGAIVLEEAGGRLSDTFGKPLDFSLGRTLKANKGVVATSAGVFDAVIKAVIESAK